MNSIAWSPVVRRNLKDFCSRLVWGQHGLLVHGEAMPRQMTSKERRNRFLRKYFNSSYISLHISKPKTEGVAFSHGSHAALATGQGLKTLRKRRGKVHPKPLISSYFLHSRLATELSKACLKPVSRLRRASILFGITPQAGALVELRITVAFSNLRGMKPVVMMGVHIGCVDVKGAGTTQKLIGTLA